MVIIRAIFELIAGMVCALVEGVFDGIKEILSQERKTEYNSKFISSGDLLSRFNKGFCLTGTKSMTKHNSFSNCSVYGPSGSGKSSVIILPSIFSLAKGGSTICCNDPSGELYEKVSGYLAKLE